MGTFGTILIAVLVFGFLIFIHEFGHYITARIFNVTITEFSIGMGPRLFHFDSKKTGIRYSLALFPIGGFVAMSGEDGKENTENADDPNRFDRKPAWQRFIITAAGAFVNIVAGFLAVTVLTLFINIGNTTVAQFIPTDESGYEISSADSGLLLGDEIIEVEGNRVFILDQLSYRVMRHGNEPIDLLVIRNGEEVELFDVIFPTIEEEGQVFGVMDFRVKRVDKNVGTVIKYSFFKAFLIVKMCWDAIYDLLSGRYTLAAVSGPVGISGAIGEAAKEGPTSLLYIVTLISINLGVMNLLPVPALDGGRLVTLIFEMITRRRVPPRVEGIINAVGLAVLLAFSFLIMIKDIVQLII